MTIIITTQPVNSSEYSVMGVFFALTILPRTIRVTRNVMVPTIAVMDSQRLFCEFI